MRTARALGIVALLVACKKESGGAPATRCEDRTAAIEEALSSPAAGACATDDDCKCYPGGIWKQHPCGGVSDTATTNKVASLASDYFGAGCKSGFDCSAVICTPSCRDGRCSSVPAKVDAKVDAKVEAGLSCEDRAAEIDKVLASASRKCTSDKDCACFRGSVSRHDACGGIIDAKTNERFEALAKAWSAAGCKLENVMCPQVVCQAACNKGTCGPAGMDKIIQ